MKKHRKIYAEMNEKEKTEDMERKIRRTIRIAKIRQNKDETGNAKLPPTL